MFKVTQLLLMASILTICQASTKNIFCYYEGWSVYHGFTVTDIDPTKCTHATYAFVGINSDGNVHILDPEADINKGGYKKFIKMKDKNTHLKVLISMGGWNEGSNKYSTVFNNPATRKTAVNSIFNFIQKHSFDGLDLDWEYPAKRGGSTRDKFNYIEFLKELRQKFGTKYLITVAVGANPALLSTSYNAAEMNKYLDFINLMTYDYHTFYDGKTGLNSPLYAGPNTDQSININEAVTRWISAGVNSQKLLLGLGSYGNSFTLKDPSNNGLNAPTSGGGLPGPITQQAGKLSYLEICKSGGWTVKYVDAQQSSYAFKGNQWVGFDNAKAFKAKAKYAIQKNLGGVMLWAIDMEDRSNVCGGGSYPLLSAVQAVFK